MFKNLMKKMDYEYDYKFDWVVKKASRGKDITPDPVGDYKKTLRTKLEDGNRKKKRGDKEDDEE